jgi:hypothetical protein
MEWLARDRRETNHRNTDVCSLCVYLMQVRSDSHMYVCNIHIVLQVGRFVASLFSLCVRMSICMYLIIHSKFPPRDIVPKKPPLCIYTCT